MRTLLITLFLLTIVPGYSVAQVNNQEYPFNSLLPNDLRSPPMIRGTQYDCQVRVREDGAENVYQAFVGGSFSDPVRNISSVACFQTAQMCDAYLNFMRGYLTTTRTASCQHGYYDGPLSRF